jgi:hypothetical protein
MARSMKFCSSRMLPGAVGLQCSHHFFRDEIADLVHVLRVSSGDPLRCQQRRPNLGI